MGKRNPSSLTRIHLRTRPPPPRPEIEEAEFHPFVPEKCPKCGGKLKDYNATTAVAAPGAGPMDPSPALIAHLFICNTCRAKLLAPPPR